MVRENEISTRAIQSWLRTKLAMRFRKKEEEKNLLHRSEHVKLALLHIKRRLDQIESAKHKSKSEKMTKNKNETNASYERY